MSEISMGPGLLNILMAWMEEELQSRLQASLSNGDISGLLTAQDDRVRKARRPSVTGKGAALVSADRIMSGYNLPATLTRLLGPRYEDWKGSGGLRRAGAVKNSVPSWPGLGRHTQMLLQLTPLQPLAVRVLFHHGRPLYFCSLDFWLLLPFSYMPQCIVGFFSKHIFILKVFFSKLFFFLTLYGR